MQLDQWQEDILDCKAKRILLCKGRQIGGTTIFAKKAAERLVKEPGLEIIVVSITEEQAQLVIVMTLSFLEKSHKNLISKKKQDTTKSKILLKNKSTIKSRPVGTTGASIRGFTGGVLWLNEGSRLPEFVFEAAKAVLLTTDGDLWMDSTPFGCAGYFYRSWLNQNKLWKVFYHTSEYVIENRPISESWTEARRVGGLRLLKEEKEEMTKLQYQQEYLGLFVGGIQKFLSDELIDEMCTIKIGVQGKERFMGIDIARMGGDETVMASGNRIDRDRVEMFDLEIPEGQTLTDTARLIMHKDAVVKYKKIFMDDGGLGVGVYDMLYDNRKTRDKVIGLNNASREIERTMNKGKTKIKKKTLLGEDMAINFKVLAENKKIKLLDDPRIRQSLRSMQCDYSEGKLKIYGNYDHIFEALKRLTHCMKDKTLNIMAFC